MAVRGYYRHPAIWNDTVVFVCEDDLWSVGVEGGVAHRITANPGTEAYPRISPGGSRLAFTSRDEGQWDVHLMELAGGNARRLTYFGAVTHVVGWSADGEAVLVATDHQQPFTGWMHLWRVPADGSPPQPLKVGPARAISYQPSGRGVVIGRNSFDPARWKRYRGGRAGSIWIDREGSGEFTELVRLPGNLADPMWIGRRIYFLSDHEGVGNLYSVTPSGRGLQRHTHHEDFYARFPSTDGRRIVYHCGGDLWLLDPEGEPRRLEVTVPSSRPQLNRKFQAPGRFLETVDLHPKGHSLALVARGAAFTMALWEGAAVRHGEVSRHRERLTTWLSDGERVVSVTDREGEEALVVRRSDGSGEERILRGDFGRARSLDVAPVAPPADGTRRRPPERLALTNHRHEVILVDLATGSHRVLHRSPHHWIMGTSWSPDGRWLAFSAAVTRTSLNLFLYDTRNRRLHQVGRPTFADFRPAFDPEGRYLYFLSARIFDPVPDTHFHDYGFPRGIAPFLIPLRADVPSPFSRAGKEPRPPGSPPGGAQQPGEQKEAKPPEVEIDLEGLAQRVVAFPLQEGRYLRVLGARGRVYFSSSPITGALGEVGADREEPRGRLESWDFGAEKLEPVADGVTDFTVSGDGKVLAIVAQRKLRVVPVGWKDDKNGKDTPGRDTGWVDLGRVRVEVVPQDEWRQMFREAWRLQRDHYWWEAMGGIDWLEIHDRYLALVDRVASRAEFSDLLWEMQGELGTSHAYELGGDYRPEPSWTQGSLGADLRFERGAWRVERIPQGDPWRPQGASPLTAPGVGIVEGDRILAVDGVEVTRERSPQSLLVDKGGREVTLTVARGRRRPRRVVVTALRNETELRYRDWVEQNRERVTQATGGRAGYLHIPDMGPAGFAEFHRAFLSEATMEGLVVDVRFNRGGNVSQLLLEKLLRRRVGYRITRWREPFPIPDEAPAGPMVCLTNENAGSDGDIFSHTFKLHGLGPLIGTRTWGGVVGIWPQYSLVDGTVTTQPEFHTWFGDVGYRVENYGAEPDIEVMIAPQDYRADHDPQLERGIAELLTIMERWPYLRPDLEGRPLVTPPRLSG